MAIQSIGKSPDLASIRRNRGISLAKVSEATKIGANYLEAIEQGSFEKLPGGVYNTSYIRQYARSIDYDEAELLEHYYRTTGLSPEEQVAPPAPAPARRAFTDILRTQLLRVLS